MLNVYNLSDSNTIAIQKNNRHEKYKIFFFRLPAVKVPVRFRFTYRNLLFVCWCLQILVNQQGAGSKSGIDCWF